MDNATVNGLENIEALEMTSFTKGHKAGLIKGIAIGATGTSAIIGGVFGIKALVGLFKKDPDDDFDEEDDEEEAEDDDFDEEDDEEEAEDDEE